METENQRRFTPYFHTCLKQFVLKNAHKSALQSKNMCALFLVKRYFLISSTISCRILQLLTEPHVFTSYKRIQMHMFVQLFCSANIFLLPEKKIEIENDNAEKKRKKNETVNFGSEILSRRIFLFQTLAAQTLQNIWMLKK